MLPLQEMVPFPDTLTPLAVGRERSMRLVNEVLSGERMLVMVASKNPEAEEPGPDELYDVGVAGVVARMLKVPDGTIRILVQRPVYMNFPHIDAGLMTCSLSRSSYRQRIRSGA